MNVTIEKVMDAVVEAAEDKKAHDIIALDLRGVSLVADYFVICSGNSDTQVLAITTEIRKLADRLGVPIRGIEGEKTARWVLIDLGDVVVHIFHREEREYYNIEKIWSDAKVVDLG
ncbi:MULTISPECIES: ribosome silencing factor [Paenibacillus]|uniref:ribosome silencing factor n=1 Tax=Paenibacillus TaxID=44249 RepID=UPI00203DCD28|nr:ribosome silencing factor [Paenibacillus camelliae]MCM3632308.1 ribosome silencing factor [Paenibacillus camelliae]